MGVRRGGEIDQQNVIMHKAYSILEFYKEREHQIINCFIVHTVSKIELLIFHIHTPSHDFSCLYNSVFLSFQHL